MSKPRVALLVNFVAPTRVRVYERLAECADLTILHGGMEDDRRFWQELPVEGAKVRRVSGWQLQLTKSNRGRKIDNWFLHVEPGYIAELIREKPDGVITDEMGFRTFVALAYGTCFQKPVWVWWGGTLRTERNLGRFRKLLRGIIARWVRRWISYGQTSTEYLLSLGIPLDRILQVQNCVDETWYQDQTKLSLVDWPRPVLLVAGRMIAAKGVAEFLRAAARLQQEGLTFSILLVGGGSDASKLQHLAASLGLSNVQFYPAQPPQAMPSFYRSADVLVFPTMEDVWGLVANEGILSGLPVLCSRYAGCAPELFDQESIFDPADEEGFVAGLRRAVRGELPRPERSRLWSSAQVGDAIAEAILDGCVGRPVVATTNISGVRKTAIEARGAASDTNLASQESELGTTP